MCPVVISNALAVVMPVMQIYRELLKDFNACCCTGSRMRQVPHHCAGLHLSSLLCLMAAGSASEIPQFRLRITGVQSLSIETVILFALLSNWHLDVTVSSSVFPLLVSVLIL